MLTWSFIHHDIGLSNRTSWNTLLIIPLTIVAIILIIIVFALTICAIKRMCVAKKTSEKDQNQQPTYEEITWCHKEISMEENAA